MNIEEQIKLAERHARRIVNRNKVKYTGIYLINGGGKPAQVSAGESTDSMMQAFIKNFPAYLQTQVDQIPVLENALLQSARETSPQFTQAELNQAQEFLPQFNALGDMINRASALADAETEAQVVAGPGRELINQAYETSQIFDAPFFEQRDVAADALGKLIQEQSAGLSGGELAAVERGLNRTNVGRGTADSNSMISTLQSASDFGKARQAQQQMLKDTLNTANQFLQSGRSGVDTFQVATGRPSRTNQGAGQGSTLREAQGSNQVFNSGQGLQQSISSFQQQANQARMDQANRGGILDKALGASQIANNVG